MVAVMAEGPTGVTFAAPGVGARVVVAPEDTCLGGSDDAAGSARGIAGGSRWGTADAALLWEAGGGKTGAEERCRDVWVVEVVKSGWFPLEWT